MTPDWQPPTERRVVRIRESATTRDIFPSCERCGTELTGKQKRWCTSSCRGRSAVGRRFWAIALERYWSGAA